MYLIHINQWLGPNSRTRHLYTAEFPAPEVKISSICMATRLPLHQAFEHISRHELAFNNHYSIGVTLTVLGVSRVPDLRDEHLHMIHAELVENLQIKYDD